MDSAQRKQAARQRRAGKVRLRRHRLTKAAARGEQYADRAAANDVVDLLADELEAAIGQTLDERRAEPAREFTSQLVAANEATALEDESAEKLGLKLVFAILGEWLEGPTRGFRRPHARRGRTALDPIEP
jgi:hypothetical protein